MHVHVHVCGVFDNYRSPTSAQQILADEEKRRRYDLTGDTGESPQGSRGHRPGEAWSMPIFRSGSSFQFRFFTGSSWQRQDLVTTNHFFDTILPGSHEKPYLLNFFHDLCLQCGDLEPIWEELRKVGGLGFHREGERLVSLMCGDLEPIWEELRRVGRLGFYREWERLLSILPFPPCVGTSSPSGRS